MVLTAGLVAAEGVTKLTLAVRSSSGIPVSNASVSVKFVKGPSAEPLAKKTKTEWETRTDPQGLAKLPTFPQGSILVQVNAAGYHTFRQTFEINEEKKTIDVSLIAGEDVTTLTVAVKTPLGNPVDNASVVVKFVKGRSVVQLGKKVFTEWETRTNQQGLAKIPPIPQGSILVQVIAKGYQTFGETFDVNEEQKTIEVKLNPPQAQYSSHE
jgi:uncharacterized GH25 family protein